MTEEVLKASGKRRLYLVRHGHVEYFDANGTPLDPRYVVLSEAGEAQVLTLRSILAGVQVDRAISSDYPRAVQSLQLALSNPPRNGGLEQTDMFREIRAGRLRDIPVTSIPEEVCGAYKHALAPGAGFLRGESWESFRERVLAKLQSLLAEQDWHETIIVSHDAVNRVMLSWLMGAGLSLLPSLEQDPASLTIVDLDMSEGKVSGAHLRLLNFTPYDPVKSGDRKTVMQRIAESILSMHRQQTHAGTDN